MSVARRRTCAVLLWLMLSLLLTGCGSERADIVLCDEAPYGKQEELVSQLLPGYALRYEYKGALQGLKNGAVALTDDFLARPAQELPLSAHWLPLYRATAVIALDRDVVGAELHGWNDLLNAEARVGISDRTPEIRLLMAAIGYGCEGESYSLEEASSLFAALHTQQRLAFNDFEAPILICFDHQVAALVEAGRNMQIIVPREGTLSFERGFLSAQPLAIAPHSEEFLLQAGFRLPDGRSASPAYPDDSAYANAALPSDYAHLAAVCEDVTYVLKRDVEGIGSYLYSSADGREHQLYALCFLVLVILWIGFVLRRVMQKGVRRTILLMTALVIGWVLLRMFKYQIPFGTLNQLCWYAYYFFRLFLSLVGMWISWSIDRPEDVSRPPRWWHICAVFNFVLFLAVFSNNLHYQAFVFDPLDPAYQVNFSYGPLYYLVMAVVFLQLLVMQLIFLRKSWQSPRKWGFLFPILFYLLIGCYCIGYMLRVPLIFETDSTIVTGIFAVVFIEACIQTGLIPVNSRYQALFERSPLNMQIVGADGRVALASQPSVQLPENDPGTLSHQFPITGGKIVWQEDIGALNRLQAEIEAANAKLVAANAMLMEEERIESKLAASEARAALFTELEAEIAKKTLRLADMIDTLPQGEEYQQVVAAITLLLCYIKRRCILFFRERETPNIALDEIVVYLDELAEFAAFAGIKAHISALLYDKMPTRRATLFYDFVYALLEWALERGCQTVLVQVTCECGRLIMKVMLPEVNDSLPLDEALLAAIAAAEGSVCLKDMDDAISVWLSFPEGEAPHA